MSSNTGSGYLNKARVLDAGCGSGWYAKYLSDRGAVVTAVDLNADFVALTKSRVEQSVTVLQCDLADTLDFSSFGHALPQRLEKNI